jgi:uncharacterized membrane protein
MGESKRFLNVIIEKGECSDQMSDNIYPCKVHVLSGGLLVTGCCFLYRDTSASVTMGV